MKLITINFKYHTTINRAVEAHFLFFLSQCAGEWVFAMR